MPAPDPPSAWRVRLGCAWAALAQPQHLLPDPGCHLPGASSLQQFHPDSHTALAVKSVQRQVTLFDELLKRSVSLICRRVGAIGRSGWGHVLLFRDRERAAGPFKGLKGARWLGVRVAAEAGLARCHWGGEGNGQGLWKVRESVAGQEGLGDKENLALGGWGPAGAGRGVEVAWGTGTSEQSSLPLSGTPWDPVPVSMPPFPQHSCGRDGCLPLLQDRVWTCGAGLCSSPDVAFGFWVGGCHVGAWRALDSGSTSRLWHPGSPACHPASGWPTPYTPGAPLWAPSASLAPGSFPSAGVLGGPDVPWLQ